MHYLYNILAVLIVTFAIPVFLFRLFREDGFGERLKQSFGFIRGDRLTPVANRGCIWLHAASVGEIVATSPIVKEIRREIPGVPILISVVTNNGFDMAKRIIPEADGLIFFPIDLPWLGYSVINRIKPRVFMPVETELWPNFLKAAAREKIPVMMVNGRISDKSVERYRYLRGVLKDMMNTVVKFCMQSTIDAQYIIRLGADPRRVVVTGNTKYDQTYTDVSPEERRALRQELGLADRQPLIVAGSSHKGEEEYVLAAFTTVLAAFPAAGLIIAPRETLRAGEVVGLAAGEGLTAVRRTELKQSPATGHQVVVLDTIGELGKIYSLGDIIFVGGSLVPHGGHNILEPAAHGKPIIVGPHMFNFRDTYALFSGRGACATVNYPGELSGEMLRLLQDDQARAAMAARCREIVRENRGAARKSALYLKELLASTEAKNNIGKIGKLEDG